MHVCVDQALLNNKQKYTCMIFLWVKQRDIMYNLSPFVLNVMIHNTSF